jgi:hypothetical protein
MQNDNKSDSESDLDADQEILCSFKEKLYSQSQESLKDVHDKEF